MSRILNMRAIYLAPLLPVVFFILFFFAGGSKADSGDSPYSIRTEPGASGHKLTTVAFPVKIQGGTFTCVVTEDQTTIDNNNRKMVALAQSCDLTNQSG